MPLAASILWSNFSFLPALAIAAIFSILVTFILYYSQLRSASRFSRFLMPLLRILTLCALLISLLKPSILRPARLQDLGSILILIDQSASSASSHWTPAQLVPLAAALHELPTDITRPSLAPLTTSLTSLRVIIDNAARAASELDYARLANRAVDPAARHLAASNTALLTAIQSTISWPDAPELLRTKQREAYPLFRTRLDSALKSAYATQSETDAKLYSSNPAVRSTCDALSKLSPNDLAHRLVNNLILPSLANTPVDLRDTPDPFSILSQLSAPPRHPIQSILLLTGPPTETDDLPLLPPGSPPIFILRCSPPGASPDPLSPLGRVLSAPDAADLPPLLQHHTLAKFVPYALWDSPYLFIFVTAALTAEWSLRKRLGLV